MKNVSRIAPFLLLSVLHLSALPHAAYSAGRFAGHDLRYRCESDFPARSAEGLEVSAKLASLPVHERILKDIQASYSRSIAPLLVEPRPVCRVDSRGRIPGGERNSVLVDYEFDSVWKNSFGPSVDECSLSVVLSSDLSRVLHVDRVEGDFDFHCFNLISDSH